MARTKAEKPTESLIKMRNNPFPTPDKVELEEEKQPELIKLEETLPPLTKKRGDAKRKELDLSDAIYSSCAIIALVLKTPEIVVDQEESTRISDALSRVLEYYELPDTGKIGAWMNLASVLTVISLNKRAEYTARKDKEALDEKDSNL